MFAHITGTVLLIEEGRLTVEIVWSGLALDVLVSPLTVANTKENAGVNFWLYHHITEVSQSVFGFVSLEERKLFKQMLKVSGVGGKIAIALLWLWITGLIKAIETGNEKLLTTVPWVGKKLALKIIVELKSSVNATDFMDNGSWAVPLSLPGHREITESLMAMGYAEEKIKKALKELPEEMQSLQEKTVWVLKELARG